MAIKKYSVFPQRSSFALNQPLDSLVSYAGHSLGESYPSVEMQFVYSETPADWVNFLRKCLLVGWLHFSAY